MKTPKKKKPQNSKIVSPEIQEDAPPPVKAMQQAKQLSLLKAKDTLIVVDYMNVAMGFGKGTFKTKGIQICIDYFEKRGHKVVGFVP